MEINKLVFGSLVAGCMAAAGGGAYLAVRDNAASEPAPAAVTAPAETPAAPAASAVPVAESEGVIEPSAQKSQDREGSPEREGFSRASETGAPRAREAATAPAPRTSRPTPRVTRPADNRPTAAAAPAPEAPAPAPQAPASTPSMWETRPSVEATVPEREPEPEVPAAPPAPEIIELVVPADSVLGLQIERTLSSELARVEDRVEARVTRDVRVGNRVAIPAGATVQGSVTEVERGGKVRETARLGVRFHTVVLADGSRLNIRTDAVVREGQSPAKESAAKIGGAAVGGAILGAILGGGRGAAIGGAVGAAGGTAAQMASGRNAAVLPAGTTVSVRIQQPVTVTVEK